MLSHAERLKALRLELARRGLDGFVVPLTDEYMSEYVGAYARRLAWLTGFQGSAGSSVVLSEKAAIFVDGRYTLQARQQVDARHWTYESVPQTSVPKWLEEHAPRGSRIGYDPWLHTRGWVTAAGAALSAREVQLVAVEDNPVDAVWPDRPACSSSPLFVHPLELAGKSSADKRAEVAAWLAKQGADAVVLSALDSIAWAFNIRGTDVDHTPVALSYALVRADGTADLFVAPEKLTSEVIEHLGSGVRVHPRADFPHHLRALDNRKVAVDPERAVAAILDAVKAAGAQVIEARDPVVLRRAVKNAAEIAGHKAAQLRDGVALCRFLHWFSVEAPKGNLTELSAAATLREFREMTGELRDLSFETISGFGPNGAIIHYHPSEQTCRRIVTEGLYLIDSGAQYRDGTTDVTRTVAVGTPGAEMRDRFTRVLKGHIALARIVFPAGTRGGQLDAIARQYLWAAGLDYAHGTSHGIGSYLSVHEGPQRIAYSGDCSEPLVPGMILSNEPGYYKPNEYGIRIENLLLVERREVPDAEREMFGFETLTLAPIDRELIDISMLTPVERAWIDSYHGRVAQVMGAQLDGSAKTWLMEVTRALV